MLSGVLLYNRAKYRVQVDRAAESSSGDLVPALELGKQSKQNSFLLATSQWLRR